MALSDLKSRLIFGFKCLVIAVAVAGCTYLGSRYVDKQFRYGNIKDSLLTEQSGPISHADYKKLMEVFSQHFFYLDRGKQSYVFQSEDGRYVVKFFDRRCLESGPHPFLYTISSEECEKRVRQLVDGYKIALTVDTDYADLVFVQLARDSSYSLSGKFIDRFGFLHEFDLATVPFAVQNTATPTRVALSKLLDEGDSKKAVALLSALLEMYVIDYQRGIIDDDHNIMYNTGFIDLKPIRLDVGRLQYSEDIKEPIVYRQDLKVLIDERIGGWLDRHYPKYKYGIVKELNRLYI